ncbi:MAG TPA: hypothetical protein VNA25_05045 [Phycisphaerae bacterium]|nr:hypothetical protein [Phycisphaerae bacterium]
MAAVWKPIIQGVTEEEMENALQEWFTGNAIPPKPNDLQRIIRSRKTPTKPEAVEYIDVRLKCRGCREEVRQGIPGSPDGGLVYQKYEGEWYAARCRMCGGPAWARSGRHMVPLPHLDRFEEGKWLPLDMTPGQLKFDADFQSKSFKPETSLYLAWLQPILKRSRERARADQIAKKTSPECEQSV